MPRANRRRPEGRRLDPRLTARETTERYEGGVWVVRRVRGREDARAYRCPGCQQVFSAGVEHVVVWPADGLGGVSDRRHWHTSCWAARGRRPPRGSYR